MLRSRRPRSRRRAGRAGATGQRTSGGTPQCAAPAIQIGRNLLQRHCIQDAIRRHAPLARHLDAPVHVIEFADRVSVGIEPARRLDRRVGRHE
jgi:hypothetical protein